MTNESERGSCIGSQERGAEESTTGRTDHVPRDVEQQSGKSKQASPPTESLEYVDIE